MKRRELSPRTNRKRRCDGSTVCSKSRIASSVSRNQAASCERSAPRSTGKSSTAHTASSTESKDRSFRSSRSAVQHNRSAGVPPAGRAPSRRPRLFFQQHRDDLVQVLVQLVERLALGMGAGEARNEADVKAGVRTLFDDGCERSVNGLICTSLNASVPFEKLHSPLVLLRRLTRLERAEVAALAGLRIGLAGVEAVFAGFEFADHMQLESRGGGTPPIRPARTPARRFTTSPRPLPARRPRSRRSSGTLQMVEEGRGCGRRASGRSRARPLSARRAIRR